MFPEIRIVSRWGNRLICTLGALFAAASTALLLYYVVSGWGAASLVDRALQMCLLVGIVVSLGFIGIGLDNLKRLRT